MRRRAELKREQDAEVARQAAEEEAAAVEAGVGEAAKRRRVEDRRSGWPPPPPQQQQQWPVSSGRGREGCGEDEDGGAAGSGGEGRGLAEFGLLGAYSNPGVCNVGGNAGEDMVVLNGGVRSRWEAGGGGVLSADEKKYLVGISEETAQGRARVAAAGTAAGFAGAAAGTVMTGAAAPRAAAEAALPGRRDVKAERRELLRKKKEARENKAKEA